MQSGLLEDWPCSPAPLAQLTLFSLATGMPTIQCSEIKNGLLNIQTFTCAWNKFLY